MLSDRERLQRRKAHPRLVELHRALGRLGSVLTVMNTGAHPDDEQSGMLATLRFAEGMRVVVACSTRGEGGQNSLGPERSGTLGVVRTAEMEQAARELDADIAWLGFGPDDAVHDFGFSKSGVDTLRRWGRDRIVERLVRAYRRDRPDIVIPTFLDVPGQHGHHRAMTEAAKEAVALAADPAAFPEQGLAPWTVAKFYLPAWSGGGGTYDDEVPPPNATTRVVAPPADPATGAAYGEIGEWSRAFHATQGMGRWTAAPKREWLLHLVGGEHEPDIRAGLPATLGELAVAIGGDAGTHLGAAERAVAEARAAFPDRTAMLEALAAAHRAIDSAARALDAGNRARHGHRLDRKLDEIAIALHLAAAVTVTAWLDPATASPGGTTTLVAHLESPLNAAVKIEPKLPSWVTAGTPQSERGLTRISLPVAADAPLATPFTESFSTLTGNSEVALAVMLTIDGHAYKIIVPPEEPLEIVPPTSVTLDPPVLVVPLATLPRDADIAVRLDGAGGQMQVAALAGATIQSSPTGLHLSLSKTVAAGRHRLPLTINGAPAHRVVPIAYPHIGRRHLLEPQALDILALDLILPAGARIGYVGGGADNVGAWLARMSLDVTALDAAALAGDLGGYTTIVVGIFAFGLRPDLAAATDKLHRWVEAGGHLLTLYHRPSDGWDPDRTPLRHLVIGSPSLRWRVTDPAAPVGVLLPNHPLLTTPNRTQPATWSGWEKERGLYFASDWDPAYDALIALNDPGEAPLHGALLSARIGQGRHTHTSLVLHTQLDRLVPGAFQLTANLIQPAG
jgi:LmbE family N-acetylglucosaminyl deacetylase